MICIYYERRRTTIKVNLEVLQCKEECKGFLLSGTFSLTLFLCLDADKRAAATERDLRTLSKSLLQLDHQIRALLKQQTGLHDRKTHLEAAQDASYMFSLTLFLCLDADKRAAATERDLRTLSKSLLQLDHQIRALLKQQTGLHDRKTHLEAAQDASYMFSLTLFLCLDADKRAAATERDLRTLSKSLLQLDHQIRALLKQQTGLHDRKTHLEAAQDASYMVVSRPSPVATSTPPN
ncbi:hypothetical protein SRHO_G00079240 [Serrasalmus rhombeus]